PGRPRLAAGRDAARDRQGARRGAHRRGRHHPAAGEAHRRPPRLEIVQFKNAAPPSTAANGDLTMTAISRRSLLAAAGAAAASTLLPRRARAAGKAKLKIGLLLPFSGTYAALGNNIADAMKLAAREHSGKLGGREIEWAQVDDESDPAKAPANVNKLIAGEKVDILTGPVHSGVSMAAFKEGYAKGGGTIVKEIAVPFPSTEFQANLSEIAALKPDAVFVFFAGAGAAKFVKDYADAGLKDKVALYGSGFLTEGVLKAQGAAAEGIKTTLHYADSLDNPANKKFRAAFKKATGRDADVYAVAGYDTVNALAQALDKVQGDTSAQKELIAALEATGLDSPRGAFRFSRAHNPIQDVYVRQVKGGQEVVLGIALKDADDPATGCAMAR